MHGSTTGMEATGLNGVTTSLESKVETSSVMPSQSPAMGPLWPSVPLQTTAPIGSNIPATHASTDGMAAPGSNSVAISMEKL